MKTQGEIKQDEIIANLRAIIRHCDSPESNNPRFEMVLELTKKIRCYLINYKSLKAYRAKRYLK